MLVIAYAVRNVLYCISFSLVAASKWLLMHLDGIAMLEFIQIPKHIFCYQLIIVQVHFRSKVYLAAESVVNWTVAFADVCCRS